MNSASQPDTPSEWSKFAPLRPRQTGSSRLESSDELAVASPSSESVTPDAEIESGETVSSSAMPSGTATEVSLLTATTYPPEQFTCGNRRCVDKRARHRLPPRPLLSAHWRAMKIGKRETLVLDLTVPCPDCNLEHLYTLVPPEWLDAQK